MTEQHHMHSKQRKGSPRPKNEFFAQITPGLADAIAKALEANARRRGERNAAASQITTYGGQS